MARAVWKGSVGLGLVEIPVGVVPAKRSDELEMLHLDRRELSPVGSKRYNKATGEEVEWEDVVRGHEHEPGEFVVLGDADLGRANPQATKPIEILHFAGEDEIDPVDHDRPFDHEPAHEDSRSHALLRATLSKTRPVGIAKVVLHTREHLATRRVRDDALVLDLLRSSPELRDPADVEVPASGRGAGVGASEDAAAGTPIRELVARLEKGLAGRGRAKVATKRTRTAARRAGPPRPDADRKTKPRARSAKQRRSA